MATQPPPPNLPLFYKNLQPLSSSLHAKLRTKPTDRAPYFATANAIPLTIDEFINAQRHFPIVFSSGDVPVPLALMGLNEGVNVFVDESGQPAHPFYVPAYVRRYPYLLAKLDQTSEELSLCFDPDSGLVGDDGDGPALFDGDKPSETLTAILKFCEDFEIAAQRTNAFVKELQEMDLLIDGEVSIQPDGAAQPFMYRGFRMVDEQKVRDMPAEQVHQLNQNGILPLIMAHLFSLSSIRDLFARQAQQGKVPEPLRELAPEGTA
ncbi:MAG TPA: SapC family protein [Allosphingosinicella sp.]|nr:SapC family protein [Allosphingosinicella sp.]